MRNSILLTLGLLIAAELNVASAQGGCEAGWSRSPDRCLSLFGDAIDGVERLTWFQADDACRAMGASLANVKRQETQPILTALLVQAPSSNVWIGLNDVDSEGAFRWPDGTPLDESPSGFVNWAPNQPDNANDAWEEDCVYLGADEAYPGEWFDGFCYYPRAYICEKPHDPTLPTVSTSVACGLSDPNYILFEDACYKLIRTTQAYQDAVTVCEGDNDGVTVPWVDDAFEEAFLQAILLNAGITTSWIGLETQLNVNSLRWSDGLRLGYTDWAEDQPASTERCGILTTDGWRDEDCGANHPVICQKNLGKREAPPRPQSGSTCPSGMQLLDDYCGIGQAVAGTWEEAQIRCGVYGETSTLAAVHTLNEDKSLGASAVTGPGVIERWIGLRKNARGQFQWEDGTVLDFVNFGGTAPTDDCVAMEITPGAGDVDVIWKTLPCTDSLGYVCRSPLLYVPPEIGGCLPGWYQLENNCFRSVGLEDVDRRNYNDADVYCRVEGGGRGKLFQVSNQLEQSLLALLLREYVGVTNLWIGLSDSEVEGQFVWTDGTPIGFSQWAPNQPNGFTDVPNEPFRDCVEVRSDPKHLGEWDDINCLERRGYICQTPLYVDLNSTDVVVPEMCENQPGYSKFEDGCYRVVNESMSFDDAQAYCRDEGAWLSTIRDSFYNSLLTLLINSYSSTLEYVWIGLRRDNIDVYGWERTNPNEERWPLTYARWDKENPKGALNICGALNRNSSWVDMECSAQNRFVCEYVETVPVPVDPEEMHCAEGWTFIGGHCYNFDTISAEYPQIHFTFSDALSECTSRYNATLPGIHDSNTNTEFTRQAAQYLGDRNIWLGVYQTVEGYYAYQDGRVIDYVNWASDSVASSSDCVGLNTGTGLWRHEGCFKWAGLVCENDPLPGPAILCEEGWSYDNGHCYYVSDAADDASWKSWEEAEHWCNARKAHLTTLAQGQEREHVLRLIAQEMEAFWIGLNNIASAGNWIWSDGTAYDPADIDQWSTDDKTNENNMEYCALITENAQWEDHNCGIRRPFICKWDTSQTEPIAPTKQPPVGECFEGAYKLEDRCYDLSSMEEPMTWIQAHKECQFRGGHLAAVHSQAVQALLSYSLRYIEDSVWLGLNRFGAFNQYYWSDGSPVDYTNWALGEPNSPFQPPDDENRINSCVQMTNDPISAGKWNDIDCETENGFVCEMRLDAKGAEQPLPYQPCPNKPDYYSNGASCFKVLAYNTTFPNARDDCEEDGADLASVGDAFEEAFITMFMSHFGVDKVWLGMQRGATEQFQWLDGWPVQFTSWASGYPTGSSNLNRCVLMTREGWKNTNCYDAHPLVCKTTTAPKPSPPPPPSGLCRPGWYEFRDQCYLFDGQNAQVSFAEALVLCQERGSSVLPASSTSSELNNFLQTTARSLLGIHSVWLGLIAQNGEFQWIDESQPVYTNWASDQPQMPLGTAICVQLTTESGGLWKNEDCFSRAGLVCQAPLAEVMPPISTTTDRLEPTREPVPQELSTEAIIGISVGFGAVLLLIILSAICYFYEKNRMNKKMYAQQKEQLYQREI